ncbi:MAG TPA: ADP-glyceromanno-heptose 6-epimerase [Usitatibacter sp.]|nr:ADP-glyceromanno-heptose 6-epimerase [Usitatibacter sp.]
MTIIVTGAAGFIGSNLVKALNERGERDIVAVDNLARADKVANLSDLDIADFIDKREFLARIASGATPDATAVLHQGACSDTMETDGRYMMENNYDYSLALMRWCNARRARFIYASSASVYGAGRVFREAREHEAPLNVYGYSKFLFDQAVRRHLAQKPAAQVAGFRYFNVYGPREAHKGRMASVAFHFYNQYVAQGRVRLFEASHGYGPGEQVRDFICVEDVVRVNLFFLDHPDASGIFNVGTGRAESFNAVARATVNAIRRTHGEKPLTLEELRAAGAIEYIAFPPALVGKYQSYTEADVSALRAAGYHEPFLDVEEGVGRYVASRLAREAP